VKTTLAASTFMLLSVSTALAFGTIRGMGQDAEHERITRHALACENNKATDNCFQKKALDSLAGRKGTFGAVGIPGRINANLRNAVEAAIADTRDKWETLKEQLVLTYGPSRGSRMVCALTRDKPKKDC